MCLVAPSPPVAELLHSTGLDRCLPICPDLPGALDWERGESATAAATRSSWLVRRGCLASLGLRTTIRQGIR